MARGPHCIVGIVSIVHVMTFQSQPLHLLVKRNQWEPKHEWESRLMFVEDNLDTHGLEKAINLSLVWANINFLGCSYPSHTHELVSDYPLPNQDVLRAERKKRERMERKRRESGGRGEVNSREGGEMGEGGLKRLREGRHEAEDSSSTDRGQETSDGPHNSSTEETDASFEQVSLQVDALISAIRKQHEKKAEEKAKKSNDEVPSEVAKMLHAMCMCHQCFSPGTSPSSQVNSIVQRYVSRFDAKFQYDFRYENERGASVCTFEINGQLIAKATDDLNKKIAKQRAAEHFLHIVSSYYQKHGRPCCPHERGRRR